ncbi:MULTISPECIES: helix-turn-helix domain-containing protein [unclassified Niallia]|uniref:PucR family transcriptional regulator n=1 Tax=unclassified Niallia TaxID=2837522 RepID=UPI001EDA9A3E|nr:MULTISPECIES: helix-turn-helix domain-containing protein [unclassified Niallia]MDL0436809.1 helix-turn-helix domain-containing protein [Niallia sp. SS-2023]UPO88279.1 helix-turn-helix domain-containing protein [Niallia sp. Man26]
MKQKLLTYFPGAVEQSAPPSQPQLIDYHWFHIEGENGWFGFQKNEMNDSQLDLLKTLFQHYLPENNKENTEDFKWSQFLFFGGNMPEKVCKNFRVIQFQINNTPIDKEAVETVFKGFIHSSSIIIWNGANRGSILERDGHFLEDEEYSSFAEALQSDFYFTITFYIGKILPFIMESPTVFTQERDFFTAGLSVISSERVLSFETILPHLLISRLDQHELEPFKNWFSILGEDKELLLTIKTFIENNGHNTNTAKKLFIHRNTLQYRLDKFTEKTGLPLKNYHNFFTAYLACLYFSQKKA